MDIRKHVIVAWSSICKPFEEGGLGLRSMATINKATMLKLGWDMLSTDLQWAKILKAHVFRSREITSSHIGSSIWCGIKKPNCIMSLTAPLGLLVLLRSVFGKIGG